jgi:hypothetical protein
LGPTDRSRRGTGIVPSWYEARAGGWPVRYQVAGAGEPVVFVHGLSGSTLWWARNAPAVAERYRIYLVDLPVSARCVARGAGSC